MQIKDVVGQIRGLLGRPGYGPVPTTTVLERLYDEMDHIRNQMNLPNQGWFLSRQPLAVDPSTDEFSITALVGVQRLIPLLITTRDDTDQFHVRREIPVVTPPNMSTYYIGPKTLASTPVFPHVATSFTFFTDQNTGQFIAKVTPQHSQSATYDIWYQPDRPAPPGFTDNYPLLESFINLVKVSTALYILPEMLEKDGSNAAQIEFRQKTLTDQRTRYDSVFQAAKQLAFLESKGTREGFATEDPYLYGAY